jgi:RHS repeat-associated protein
MLYYSGTDHLGGTIRTADATFMPIDAMRYKPFGEARDAGLSLHTDQKFTGQIEDASIGLYWISNGKTSGRSYDMSIGRFTQPDFLVQLGIGGSKSIDSLGSDSQAWLERRWTDLMQAPNPQLLNRYSYVANNPIKHVDPDGHIVWFAVGVGAVVGAAVGGVGYVAGSLISGHQMDGGEALVAIGVGAASGALAPIAATTAVGAVVLGAASNVAQYALTQIVKDEEIRADHLVVNGALGAIGGKIDGTADTKLLSIMEQQSSDTLWGFCKQVWYDTKYTFSLLGDTKETVTGSTISNLDLTPYVDLTPWGSLQLYSPLPSGAVPSRCPTPTVYGTPYRFY